jgi:hypothetical protein
MIDLNLKNKSSKTQFSRFTSSSDSYKLQEIDRALSTSLVIAKEMTAVNKYPYLAAQIESSFTALSIMINNVHELGKIISEGEKHE